MGCCNSKDDAAERNQNKPLSSEIQSINRSVVDDIDSASCNTEKETAVDSLQPTHENNGLNNFITPPNNGMVNFNELGDTSLQPTSDISGNLDSDIPEPSVKKKSEIIPDVSMFEAIDEHVKKAPKTVRTSVETLASYLTQPAKNALDSIRGFYKWIQLNISYDTHAYISGTTTSTPAEANDVIRSGLAVCEGYSNLFRDLCRVAGIPVRRITGYSKGYGFKPEMGIQSDQKPDHAWNAVFVVGEWRLVDCTWGTGYINEEGTFERTNNEFYFLTDPEHFATSHFPYMDENTSKSEKWQLLLIPLDLETFNKVVMIQSNAYECGMKLVSHSDVVILVDMEGQITISFSDGPKVTFTATLKGKDGKIFNKYIMTVKDNNLYTITVRPPSEGTFYLDIFGRREKSVPRRNKESTMKVGHLVKYVINCTAVDDHLHPFPENWYPWGPISDVTIYGFSPSVDRRVTFMADAGVLTILLPITQITAAMATLSHAEKDIPDIDNFVLLEATSSEILTKVRTPNIGFYKLSIFAKQLKSRSNTMNEIMRYLIECKETPYLNQSFPKWYTSALRYQVTLVEPTMKNLPANSEIKFKLNSPLLKTILAKKKPYKKRIGCQFELTLTTPNKGDTLVIYGSDKEGPYSGLYEFSIV